MVEAFKAINEKNGNMETLYAVIGRPSKADAYREVAAYKKEALAKVKDKFKTLYNGYLIRNDGKITLYAGETSWKAATRCVIVRR